MDQSQQQRYLILSAALFLAFVFITVLVINGSFSRFDHYIDQTLPYSTNNIFYYVSIIIANLYFPLVGGVVVLLWNFARKKQKFEVLMLLLSFSGLIIVELILKPIFLIPCPSTYYANVYAHQGLFSIPLIQKFALLETCYPSGHTAFYIVSFGFLTYLTLTYLKNKWLRYALAFLFISIICLVGPSRIYLHVHWFSDVVASYFLGFALLVPLILIHKRFSMNR